MHMFICIYKNACVELYTNIYISRKHVYACAYAYISYTKNAHRFKDIDWNGKIQTYDRMRGEVERGGKTKGLAWLMAAVSGFGVITVHDDSEAVSFSECSDVRLYLSATLNTI